MAGNPQLHSSYASNALPLGEALSSSFNTNSMSPGFEVNHADASLSSGGDASMSSSEDSAPADQSGSHAMSESLNGAAGGYISPPTSPPSFLG
jgi:hypothetical protein